MTDGYLDTNVFIRHITQDHHDHSPRASALFERVEARKLQLRTSDPVIFEVVNTLQTFYKAARMAMRIGITSPSGRTPPSHRELLLYNWADVRVESVARSRGRSSFS